jgi:hypothetical protein
LDKGRIADASEMIDKIRHIDLSLIYAPELLELAWGMESLNCKIQNGKDLVP